MIRLLALNFINAKCQLSNKEFLKVVEAVVLHDNDIYEFDVFVRVD